MQPHQDMCMEKCKHMKNDQLNESMQSPHMEIRGRWCSKDEAQNRKVLHHQTNLTAFNHNDKKH